jgi:hypothetical protein
MIDPGLPALLRRVHLLMAVLGAAGLLGFAVAQGLRGFLGFLAGAGASTLSFYLLHRTTAALEKAATGGSASTLSTVFFSLRLLLIGGALYAIVKSYEVSLTGLAAGLLLSVAAVTLANLYDWFHS